MTPWFIPNICPQAASLCRQRPRRLAVASAFLLFRTKGMFISAFGCPYSGYRNEQLQRVRQELETRLGEGSALPVTTLSGEPSEHTDVTGVGTLHANSRRSRYLAATRCQD